MIPNSATFSAITGPYPFFSTFRWKTAVLVVWIGPPLPLLDFSQLCLVPPLFLHLHSLGLFRVLVLPLPHPPWVRTAIAFCFASLVKLHSPRCQKSLQPWLSSSFSSPHSHSQLCRCPPSAESMTCQGYCTGTGLSHRYFSLLCGTGSPNGAAGPPGPLCSLALELNLIKGPLQLSSKWRNLPMISWAYDVKILHQDLEWSHHAKDDRQLLQNMVNALKRPHMSDHVCCGPLKWLILSCTTSSGHLSLMPWTSCYHCSKDTVVFPGITSPLKVLICGLSTLSPVWSTLESWELTNVGDRLRGVYQCLWDGITAAFLVVGYAFTTTPGTLGFVWGKPTQGVTSLFGWFWFGGPPTPHKTVYHPGSKLPLSVTSVTWTPGSPIALPLSWACWGEDMCQLSYPWYILRHKIGCHPS